MVVLNPQNPQSVLTKYMSSINPMLFYHDIGSQIQEFHSRTETLNFKATNLKTTARLKAFGILIAYIYNIGGEIYCQAYGFEKQATGT